MAWAIGASQPGEWAIGASMPDVVAAGTILPQITNAYMAIFIKIFIVLLIF